jgi:tetratricopeptide (TPR) repeat protein
LRAQGKIAEGIAEYHKAIRVKPDYEVAHENLGNALLGQGKLADAVTAYREALRLKPDHAGLRNNVGLALDGLGKSEQAIDEFREAVRLAPGYTDAHLNLAFALNRQRKFAQAIAEYREALRITPEHFAAHFNLGIVLDTQGKTDEAIAEYRQAVRLAPNRADAHLKLGNALSRQRKFAQGAAEYRAALRLNSDIVEAHHNLGATLAEQGKVDDAIAEFRQTVRLAPDNAEAYCNLGTLLQTQGKFREAVGEMRKGRAIGAKQKSWRQSSEQRLRQAEHYVQLEDKLPRILRGELNPIDPYETRALAELCYLKQFHGASARFWHGAFQASPELAADVKAGRRYDASRAAALAGTGRGRDEPRLEEMERARWRGQALTWLRADLAVLAKMLEPPKPEALAGMRNVLSRWKEDPDLAGVRDGTPLGRLAEAEQKTWKAFWAEVDALLVKAGGNSSP